MEKKVCVYCLPASIPFYLSCFTALERALRRSDPADEPAPSRGDVDDKDSPVGEDAITPSTRNFSYNTVTRHRGVAVIDDDN